MFLIEYIKKYKATYISVAVIFLIGIGIGIFVAFKIPEKEKINTTHYLQNTAQVIDNQKIDRKSFFKEKLLENLKDTRNSLVLRMHYYS